MPRLHLTRFRITGGVVFGLAVLGVAAALYVARGTGLKQHLFPVVKAGRSALAANFLQDIVLNPWFYLVVGGVIVL